MTSRAPLLPLTTDSDHLDLEEELDYEAADLFSFAPAPNPLDETSPSSRTEGCTLLEYTLKSALLDTPKPGLTLSHCLKCGWVAIDEMPYEVYCRIAGQVMALGMRRGESGWMDSIWGCLEPEPGFNAPFGVPVPARWAGRGGSAWALVGGPICPYGLCAGDWPRDWLPCKVLVVGILAPATRVGVPGRGYCLLQLVEVYQGGAFSLQLAGAASWYVVSTEGNSASAGLQVCWEAARVAL